MVSYMVGKRAKRRTKDEGRYISLFWKYPKLTVLFITIVETALYFDRGAIASAIPKIQFFWGLDAIEEGVIASIFTVGFMCASPVWAHIGMRVRINVRIAQTTLTVQKVMAWGLFIFAISAAGCGFMGILTKRQKWGYYVFMIFRFFVGLGEAATISLGFTIVDELSPPAYKTLYMAALMMAPPFGIAIGYGVTGFLVTKSWQNIFFGEAFFVFVCAVLCYFVPMHDYPKLTIDPDEQVAQENAPVSINENDSELTYMEKKGMIKKKPYGVFTSLIPLVKNPVYVSIVVLTCIYGAIIGALTFWCPSYLQMRLKRYGYSQEDTARISNIGFGIIVVLGSTVGTTLGAVALDKSGGATGWKGVARALFWCGVFVTIALPFGYVSFLMEEIPMMAMFTIFFFGVFFVLCITSPFQVALNNCVPADLRHFANSYQIFFLHVFGDLPSPILFGVVTKATSFKYAMVILWSLLVPGFLVLLVGAIAALFKSRRQSVSVYQSVE